MHIKQETLLNLIKEKKLDFKSLRKIGIILSEKLKRNEIIHAQTVKFHLDKLSQNSFINWDKTTKIFRAIEDREFVVKNRNSAMKKAVIGIIDDSEIYNLKISGNKIIFNIK